MACKNGKCELAGRVRYYREAGVEALREGDVTQAEKFLRQAIDLAERDQAVESSVAQAVYRLGLVLHEAGRPDEAANEFEKALDLARARGGSGSKLYRKILGHYAQALPERSRTVMQ
jgi:tetratricopeptide (TPR) repeat protein